MLRKKEMVLCYGNRIKNIQKSGGKAMNEIIREIEAAQLKAEVPAFETGDTVRVYGLSLIHI